MFGQKLIIDLDYDQYMTEFECRMLCQNIGQLYYQNRVNLEYPDCLPYDIHFTNCFNAARILNISNGGGMLHKHLKRIIDNDYYYQQNKQKLLAPNFHFESFLQLPDQFPKHRLIYLSPHASIPLWDYSHDDIYILGG